MTDDAPALPAPAPLDMPEQRLDGHPPAVAEMHTRPPGMFLRRAVLVLVTAVITLYAGAQVRLAYSADGLDPFEFALLACFIPLFAWIAFGAVVAAIGFAKLVLGEHRGFVTMPLPAAPLARRTAVLMPICNEAIEDTFDRIETMVHAIAQAGGTGAMDFFVLSDSAPAHGELEHARWRLLARHAPIPVYYRRRERNTARKPGNIADWVRHFGGAYEHMLVLDADSLMSGRAIVGLAAIMEARPSIGLVQTVPLIAQGRTLFQRWMQFAAMAYGSVASAGLAWWSGSEANFWGHNAIVRTRAFAESCGLPELPGAPPFGGPIQSHDMVESALLRRRGWAGHMVMIIGSYEEAPPTIVDFALRDRRWMQGNLQHLRLLGATGLSATSRLHLLLGACAYLASPAWLLMMVLAIGAAALRTGEASGAPGMPLDVLALTLALLFGPKLLATGWLAVDGDRRRGFGGGLALFASVLAEIALSILFAPVAMVMQTKALGGLLLGVPSGWASQVRAARQIPLRMVLPNVREHLALGLVFAATLALDGTLGLWLGPVTLGLLTAPWLITLTSSEALGERMARLGLFTTPEPDI